MPRRILSGVVTGTKMDKTIVVSVERTYMHPLYKKFLKTSKKYHVHNENPDVKVGDKVEIIETKPFSKTVAFEVKKD
ncbi:MAG: 30S ribosomal protein S17 [Rickettsiales bacterium]|jgi:small subunit ribosomal protein S17|nr:30S ribosomal protein S17 [Rickettsiales bacterium]